ncbi:hypothetical protein JI735_34145 (plasmid) [Paenibacillus sonchi]|uniref:JAB domain-containing protein n=1 Tax=Paenibacillus sonchi TaxID=373687 RepID=A0A974SFD0_9BACL|nr:hypothetical protein [Paenibacillus sonchi]QQZ64483.1 hypothetical protein JI735_34145 [Paenibacillus sonchi]
MTNQNPGDLFSLFMPKSTKGSESDDHSTDLKNLGDQTQQGTEKCIGNKGEDSKSLDGLSATTSSVGEGKSDISIEASELEQGSDSTRFDHTDGEEPGAGNVVTTRNENEPQLFSLFRGRNAAKSSTSQNERNGFSLIGSGDDPECECKESSDPEELADEELDVFAEEDEVSEEDLNKLELAGKSNVTAPKSTTSNSKGEKKPEINRGTFIAYAGKTISITKLFSDEALPTLEMDTIRKRLEKYYPELSKQRTTMDWDDKKNLICPIVTKGKKGSFFSEGIKGFFFKSKDLFENMESINVLAAKDGYYEVRENPIGVFVTKVEEVEELENCCQGFKLALPKIPNQLFSQLITFFADYSTEFEVEVLGVFYWDSLKLEYVLDIPTQRVSKSRVFPQYKQFPAHIFKVAEVHSHNTMRAYFSDIDNEDEAGTMLYGVIGKIQKAKEVTFEMVVRAGAARHFIPSYPIC